MKTPAWVLVAIVMILGAMPVYCAAVSGADISLNYIIKTKMPVDSVEVIRTFPHDREAYTQGLSISDGFLFESTGLYGKSGLFKKDIKTGKILQELQIDQKYFGEGIVVFKDKIYQLTWQNEILILYDFRSFKELKKIRYQGEGWGITTDGRHLFMSNGSSTIYIRDPVTFKIIREIHVRDGKIPIEHLNELEFIDDEIWANIYMEDLAVRISPRNGKVKGWIDLSPIRSYLPGNAQVDVINGIAYDERNGRIFVTGKLWPKLFEIRIKTKKLKNP